MFCSGAVPLTGLLVVMMRFLVPGPCRVGALLTSLLPSGTYLKEVDILSFMIDNSGLRSRPAESAAAAASV